MGCALSKELKEEHAGMRDQRLGEIIVQCPILSKQICFWCCLHVHDITNPLSRNYASELNPNLVKTVVAQSGRDLDSMWETCARCHIR